MRIASLLALMVIGGCAVDPTETPPAPTGPGPLVASGAVGSDERVAVYDLQATAGNPLKGFLTSYQWTTPDERIPHALEFLYLPLSAVIEAPQSYSFDAGLEPHLNASESRGNHLILRFYLDYPGRESGLPAWLSSQISCADYSEYGGGCSPDYADPLLQATLLDFIAALGARYDGDPRLGFVQMGLLGFWGEWHTYPHEDWFASSSFQQQVISAFDQAFAHTHILMRYPLLDSPTRTIGYHDDSFAYSTLGDIPWFFYPKLLAAQAEERWRVAPIGGEVYPPLQDLLFSPDYTLDTYRQDFAECVRQTHTSWMINNAAFRTDDGYADAQLEGAQAASLAMGYAFAVPRFIITASGLHQGKVDVDINVEIANTGVAPFYYPLALHLSDGVNEARILASDLHTLQPGQTRSLRLSLAEVTPTWLSHTFSLSLHSPVLLGDQVIRFADANDEQGVLRFSPAFNCSSQGRTLSLGELDKACFCDAHGGLTNDQGRACD